MRIWCNVVVASDGKRILIHEMITNKHLIMHYINESDRDRILEQIKNITLNTLKEQDDICGNVYQRSTQEQYSGDESSVIIESNSFNGKRIRSNMDTD